MAKKVISPFPLPPDPKEYDHLTMKDRMLAGYPYRPGNPQLSDERMFAREMIHKFNFTAPAEREERRNILRQLINPDSHDNCATLAILPPFQVDYGYNISVGKNVFLNFNCVILDCASVKIGDNFMAAPGVQIYSATHPLDAKHRQDDDN